MLISFFIILSLFVGITGRLVYLSGGREIAQYASVTGSRVISVGINGARGVIYDRNGVPLVGGEERDAVLCEPMSLDEESADLLRAQVLDMTAEELDRAISSGRPFLAHVREPITGRGLTGLQALARYGGLAQNLMGYLDSAGHGVVGVEAAMDEALYAEGYAYTALFTADAARRALSGYGIAFEGSAAPVKQGVALSLDREIQEICEAVANEKVERGVVLVSDVRSGQLCAWVSRPTYDPLRVEEYLEQGDAMLNKGLHNYCCGSVFKIIVTAAALEAGIELPAQYECTGSFVVGEHTLSCAKKEGHGIVDATEAFAQSCNPYFCHLASLVGAQGVLEMAEKFGLGQATDFGYGITAAEGRLPSLRDLSVAAALANFSIGQGDLQVTPVQVLEIGSIIANGGVRQPVHLFEKVLDEQGESRSVLKRKESTRVISESTAAQIRDMMVASTQGGSGAPAAASVYRSAVKTSSAETGIYENGNQILHTWVTGFYPAQEPQYAIAVLVEGGQSGYRSAAPVFGEIVNRMYGCGLIESVL